MKKLIIAEKPELAQAITESITGNLVTKNGYYEKGNYIITWAYGHVMRLKSPEEYNSELKVWDLKALPIYFKNWEVVPSKDKYKQFNIIKELLKSAEFVIHAGDIDEEGQLLIDEILEYCKYKGETKRLQTASFNKEYLQKSLENLEPNSKYIPWSKSANARRIADFMVGINLSRYFSIINNTKLSLGRVQTPTLRTCY